MNIEINKITHYFFCKIIPAITILYITRELYLKLNSSDFVLYTILFSASISLSNLFTGWFCQSNLRFGVNDNKQVDSINSYFILLFLSFVCICFICIFIVSYNYVNYIAATLLSLSLSLYNILYTYIQSKSKSKYVLKMEIIRSLILAGSFVFLTICNVKLTVLIVLLVYSLSYLVSFISLLGKYIQWVGSESVKNLPIEYIKTYIKFGFPMSIWMVIATSYPLIERNIINYFYPVSISSSYFALSELFNRGIGIIFIPLIMYVHPLLMKLYDNNYLDFENMLSKFIKIELLIGLLSILFCYFTSSIIIPILLPGLPLDFVHYSYLFILPPLLWQVAFLAHKKHEASKKTIRLLLTLSMSVIIYIFMMFIFLYYFSVIYAILAQVVSLLIYILISLYYKSSSREYNINCKL
ncbi:hypothetical protein GLP30_07600 [Photobacterium phosphoreum]|uniref:Uncharacterized protein n=1 Tax=Photobacterium phosphoreum TaxID=659 RepID=A0AAW4ZLL3_PHOPO|nr:hypothetical protein [Photobacterium phosphoreum]MCD9490699.1 hypothetical protein [Photobacterium phosphoreum]MCF2189965.1 hypothetical protein [Photobacterium phosphoreum]MCF2300826.1 hypothetical protein [Photobacterium phosphoreum]